MAKYNVGDKVRIVSERGEGFNRDGLMDKYLGAVITIRETNAFGFDEFYRMEEDKSENFGHGWLWDEDYIVGLVDDVTEVKEDAPKYKVGDRVIIECSNVDWLFHDHSGLEGTIQKVDHTRQDGYHYQVVDAKNKYGVWCKVF